MGNKKSCALPPSAQSALQWTRTDKAFRLTIADKSLAEAGAVDFFPLPESSTLIGHPQRVARSDGSLLFTIPIESAPAGQQSLAGLIVAGDHAFSLGNTTAAAAIAAVTVAGGRDATS